MPLTFSDDTVRNRIRLDGIACVVDTDRVFPFQDHPSRSRLTMLKTACAEVMILDNAALPRPGQVAKVHGWLARTLNRLQIVEARNCTVPLELLPGPGAPMPRTGTRSPGPAAMPAEVVRCKSVVHSLDAPNGRAVLKVVGRRTNLSFAEPWGNTAPCACVVAIGPRRAGCHRAQRIFGRCPPTPECDA
jgi:hypothetical protein